MDLPTNSARQGNLFSRHPQEDHSLPSSCNWPGQSGKQYQYEIYPLDTAVRIFDFSEYVAAGESLAVGIARGAGRFSDGLI